MLTAAQFQQWSLRLHLSLQASEVVTHVRTSPPACRVGSRANNVSGTYASRKMGCTIQFESHKVELWAVYTMEYDPQVLEYYDQPTTLELHYQATGGLQQDSGRSMGDSPRHLLITPQEWQAFLDDFQQTLSKFNVPQSEQHELFALIESTREAIVISPLQENTELRASVQSRSDNKHPLFHVRDGARKEFSMATHTPSLVQRTFRITVDVETIITAEPRETLGDGPEGERYHQALVQHLLVHSPVLRQLLRSSAVEALLPAKKMLEAEYGWGRISDQQLLQPIIAELEPAAQAYFTEELEDGASVYYFDGYAATIKRVRMEEVGDEGA